MKPAYRHFEFARSLFREANDAFFLFDPLTQIILDLNPAALRLIGLEKDTACSKRLEDLFAGSGTGGLDGLTQALNRTGFFHSREGYFLRRRSRSPLPVNLSVSRIHIEPETIGLVVARDISDRKEAEEALKQVETRYKGLIASTGVIVWELDADGQFASMSPAFQDITGWAPADWIGRPLVELLSPDDGAAASRIQRIAWQGETLPRHEFRIRTRAGDCRECESLLVTRIQEGPSGRILEIVRDITEQKRVAIAIEQAETLRQEKEAAERANRAKSEFLSSVSHEIRTPLSAVLGFVELLRENPYLRSGPAEIVGQLGSICQNGEYLLALIDDLLDLSRIESGQLIVERELCSTREVVSGVVESLRAKAEAKHLRLEVEVMGVIPETIDTDRLRLRQVLVNLVDNAIKFTRQGEVRLTVRSLDRPDGDRFLAFDVADTGIGIVEAEFPRLFGPFYRVRSLTPDSPAGTGLGLAICDRVAKRLGGEIRVQSRPDEGSTFTLSIPVGPHDEPKVAEPAHVGSAKAAATASSQPTQPRLNARILVTDDNEANQQLISIRLRRAGAEVVTALNGREALDRVREAIEEGRLFDALLMDMQMPVLDGYEAVRQLRAGGFTDPIMAVTAYAIGIL